MVGRRKSLAKVAVTLSLFAPVIALGTRLPSAPLHTREAKIIVGGAAVVIVLAGFILALVVLTGALRHGRKGVARCAGVGLALNGACLMGCVVVLVPVLRSVAQVRDAGYTRDQMQAMPDVIDGSREILNEALGFRMEVPGDFVDNMEPQSPRALYSFLHAGANGVDRVVNIERLGGRIAKGPVGPEFYAGARSRLPPDVEIERVVMSWKAHELEVFRVQFSTAGGPVCAWSAQVPLAREAIQVTVGGKPDASDECRELLRLLLTGVQGVSNWEPPSSRALVSKPSFPRGLRASVAAAPVPAAGPPTDLAVAPGNSEVRTFAGEAPGISRRNPKLVYEFDLSVEPVLIHVPANYDGSEPFGLIVLIPADGPYRVLPGGWDKVLEENRIIVVSPQKALNSRDADQRCGLAVVCALKMREVYRIDPGRILAAGYSGGARIASELGYYHADLFRGTIQSCGSNFHRPVAAVNAVPLERDGRAGRYGVFKASSGEVKAAREKVRFVIITGSRDFRYGHLLDIYEGGFAKEGFQARLIDVPWMEHVTCGPDALRQALDFIEPQERARRIEHMIDTMKRDE